MSQRITRRRFGQLATAGITVTGLSYIANKTLAQTPNSSINSITPGLITSTNPTAQPEVNSTELNDITTASTDTVSTSQGLVTQPLNLVNGQVQPLANPELLGNAGGAPLLQSQEEVSALTTLANGTRVVAINPVSGSKNAGNPTRLVTLGSSPISVDVSGLNQGEKLESLVGTKDGGLLGLVQRKNSTPPARLVNVNPQTGQITSNNTVNLPANQRFITLAQCPDGTLYTITTGQQGNTSLVKLDQAQNKPIIVAQLSFNGVPWNNGVESLVCSSTGQLLALAAPRYSGRNALYNVNPSTGAMSLVQQLDAAKITVAPM